MKTKKYGYWKSNGIEFSSKIQALLYATKNNTDVKFIYHDEVWKNFDRNLLGKVPLNQLYKERAEQLRDRYEYLILYYSGGADSHNILMTFLNNNIKLDEIIVKWPKPLTEGKLYNVNTSDRTSRNIWSEWDYVVKPTLEWLKTNHPEIKITMKDYTEELTVQNLETVFESVNHTRAGLLQIFTNSENDKKKCGHLFGIDKPLLAVRDDNVYMFFSDLSMTTMYMNKTVNDDPDNMECFYWAPDFPFLTFEMAYQLSEYFNIDKKKRKFLRPMDEHGDKIKQEMKDYTFQFSLMIQVQNNVTKMICYDTWDPNKFQADKPLSVLRQDKFFWFFENDEFKEQREAYLSNMKSLSYSIGERFLSNFHSTTPGIKPIQTDAYFVRKLDK